MAKKKESSGFPNARVIFRKIRGRIIPIKIKDKKDLALGVGEGGLGTLVAFGGGLQAGKLAQVARAERAFASSIDSALKKRPNRPSVMAREFSKFSKRIKARGMFATTSSRRLLLLSAGGGALVAGRGIGRIRKNVSDDSDPMLESAAGAGVAATIAAAAFLKGSHPARGIRTILRHTPKLSQKLGRKIRKTKIKRVSPRKIKRKRK